MALASLDKIDAGCAALLVECEGLSPLVELALSRHCAPLERYRRPGRNTPVTPAATRMNVPSRAPLPAGAWTDCVKLPAAG